MKRVKAIFFLVCFLIAHSGISISTHWCGHTLTHISVFEHDSDPCECGKVKKAMKSDCCKDKTATLKAKSDLATASITPFKVPVSSFILPYFHQVFSVSRLPVLYTTAFPDAPPPYRPNIPLYILDGVFLI